MRTTKFLLNIFLVIFLCNCTQETTKGDFYKDLFKNPPEEVKVHTWWHWIDGRITREGITKDLESMKKQGVVQATILNIGMSSGKNIDVEKVLFDSDEWYEMFKWALTEANRLGITIGVHNCDGWSESGGPWITPEMSMKKFVFSTTQLSDKTNTILPKPICETDYYRDIAVIAFKKKEKYSSFERELLEVNASGAIDGMSLVDGNPESMIEVKDGHTFKYKYQNKRLITKVSLLQNFKGAFYFPWPKTIEYTIKASNDGEHFRKITDISTKKFYVTDIIDIPPTKAKYFQVEVKKIHELRPWHHAALAELQLLGPSQDPLYNPTVLNPLEKIASARVIDIDKLYASNSEINQDKIIEKSNVINLTGEMTPDGILNWDKPEGDWSVIRFGYTTTGAKNGPATKEGTGLECDKMDTVALNYHFSQFPQKLIDHSGQYAGNTFKFFLIDSWERGYQTWTKAMPEEFKKLRGYDLINWIPVLCGETIESQEESEGFLYDFRKTVADLFELNYYKHFNELCHRNGLELHGEVIYGDNGPFPPVDVLKTNDYMDMPMYEFWADRNRDGFVEYKPKPQTILNFPVYASNFYNKPVIGTEAFTGFAHYSESPSDLKLFGDRAFCSGVNQMILHSYVHQPSEKQPGLTLGQHGSHFNRHYPAWQHSRSWLTYLSRCQYILQKGVISSDVLYYLGDQLPQFFENKAINSLPRGYQTIPCNYDVLTKLSVKDNKLVFPRHQEFSILVLPDKAMLEYATLKQVERLLIQGALIYGGKPERMFSLGDQKEKEEEFKKLAGEIWVGYNKGKPGKNNYGEGSIVWGNPLSEVLYNHNVNPDFTTNEPDSLNLMYIHKTTQTKDIFYVINQKDSAYYRECVFKVSGNRIPEIWDPMTGEVREASAYFSESGVVTVPVEFKSCQSLFFIFSEKKRAADITKSNTTDTLIIESFKGKIVFKPINFGKTDTLEISDFKSFTDYHDPKIKYFSGTAVYDFNFSVPASYLNSEEMISLSLGEFDATAEIILNDYSLGTTWLPDNKFSVEKYLKEQNNLKIILGTTVRNRIIGDFKEYGEIQNVWTAGPVGRFLNKSSELKPSGIIGPVQLIKN